MRAAVFAGIAALALSSAAWGQDRVEPVNPATKPPPAPTQPFSETLFGTTLNDPYRYMEKLGPETKDWMLAQGAYTDQVFASIPNRKAYGEKLSQFGAGFGFATSFQDAGDRAFYLERGAGADAYDLMVRDADGTVRRLIDVNGLNTSTGQPHAINYYLASKDGTKVAVGLSEGGSEAADLYVYDATTGAKIAGPVSRAQFGSPNWTRDDQRLFFVRLQDLSDGQPITEKYQNTSAVLWDLKGEPVPLAGGGLDVGPKMTPTNFPIISVEPKASEDLLLIGNGVENELAIYTAPKGAAEKPDAPWREMFDRDAGVTGVTAIGDDLYLLSHQDAPTFKVLKVRGDAADLSAAETVVEARPDRVISAIGAASDGLYLIAREGLYGKLLKLQGDKLINLLLPVKGSVDSLVTDPARAGAVVTIQNFAMPPTVYRYEPAKHAFTDLHLGARPDTYDPGALAVHDLKATAKDGVEVPLSVITPAGPMKPRPVLMEAYGSYGIPILPAFSPRDPVFVLEGGTIAYCHVRGGGELGEAWRLAGKGANKPNTWNDFIACAETLIAQGYTTPDMLTVWGASAGGIAVGRALTARPDLFAGAVARVPMFSAVRAEFQQNGPANIPEFGTIADPQGFRDLYEMDAYFHVVDGTKYPAVLFTTGLNDPRVDPWQPAKGAARMQAAGSPNPVLLRIEKAGGHGIGSTRSQRDAEEADIHSFAFWRAGLPGWQPAP